MSAVPAQHLVVYLEHEPIGRPWLNQGRKFVCRYDRSWLKAEQAIPLSIRLPLAEREFNDDETRPFFANQVPHREIVNAILYILRAGCARHLMPHDLLKWLTVWVQTK